MNGYFISSVTFFETFPNFLFRHKMFIGSENSFGLLFNISVKKVGKILVQSLGIMNASGSRINNMNILISLLRKMRQPHMCGYFIQSVQERGIFGCVLLLAQGCQRPFKLTFALLLCPQGSWPPILLISEDTFCRGQAPPVARKQPLEKEDEPDLSATRLKRSQVRIKKVESSKEIIAVNIDNFGLLAGSNHQFISA